MTHPDRAVPETRIAAVDLARGLAILAMVAYHLAWDLSFLGFLPFEVSEQPLWVAFQRTIVTAFLLLVGAGLTLGHGDGIRWPAFWRRFAILAVAAGGVSLATWFEFGEALAFFGILHAIALFSLMALPFLRAPPVVTLALAAAVVLAPLAFHDESFNAPWLAWLGFWVVPPRTADLVPVFPWFGVVLIGIAGMHLALRRGMAAALAPWRPRGPALRAVALAGRWSLLIYLVHQPLLFGALSALAPVLAPPTPGDVDAFVAQCRPNCVETGGVEGYCAAYCACALDQIEGGNLWAAVNAMPPTAEQTAQVNAVITLCRAMAEGGPRQSAPVVNGP